MIFNRASNRTYASFRFKHVRASRVSLFVVVILGIFFTTIYSTNIRYVYADGWSLVGSNSATGTVSVAMPITDVQVSGGSTTTVPVKLRVTSGSLQMATTTGLTFNGSQTGSTIYFSGTRDNVNAALASLSYTRGSTGTDTLEVSLVESGEVFFTDNGHLYEYVSFTATWNNAKIAAEGRTKYGATGYLVTVGSQAENDFVAARLLNAGWMGSSDSVSEGTWRWVTGPESGTQFWSGLSNGSTVGGNYANWGPSEPNNLGDEDCGQFLTGGTGKWNDLPCSSTTLPGYVVEYGATGTLPAVTAKNIAIATVSTPTVSTFSPADNTTNIGTSTNLAITFTQPVYAGTGTLAIWDYTNLLIHQPTAIDDTNIISGLGTDTITINPTNDFSENTNYYVIIDSNAFKNGSNGYFAGFTATTTWNFRTGDFTGPVISAIASSTNQTTATISWSTNENATGTVSYGLNTAYASTSVAASTLATSQSITVTGLAPGTAYHFRVNAYDASGNFATSSDAVFTTKPAAVINPVGYWKLDETSASANAVDEIGTNTGIQSGTPAASTTVPSVNFVNTGSRGFNGSNYFTINRPVQDDFTICAWIKTSSAGGGSNHWESAPILDSESGGLANDFGFGIGNGGRLMYGNGGGFDAQVNGTTVINDNAWHNVCATRNGTTGDVKLYVDAVLDGSGTTSGGTLDHNPYARIGYGYDGAAHYVGLIDDLRIYDTDLNQTQLLSIFQGNNDANTAPVISLGGCSSTFTTVNGLTYTTRCGVTTVTGTPTVTPAAANTISTPSNTLNTESTTTVAQIQQTPTVASSTQTTFVPVTPTLIPSTYQFPRNLRKGMTGADVKKLQQFLNTHGFPVSASGAGSLGNETSSFSSKTESAVMEFQAAHANDILAPQKFTQPTGYFYTYTRGLANKMLTGGK